MTIEERIDRWIDQKLGEETEAAVDLLCDAAEAIEMLRQQLSAERSRPTTSPRSGG